jgi:hypothetical protein
MMGHSRTSLFHALRKSRRTARSPFEKLVGSGSQPRYNDCG